MHNDSLLRAVFARPHNLRVWLRDLLGNQPIAQRIEWKTLAPLQQISADSQLEQKHRDLAFVARQIGSTELVMGIVEMVTGNRRGIGKKTVGYAMDSIYEWHENHPADRAWWRCRSCCMWARSR